MFWAEYRSSRGDRRHGNFDDQTTDKVDRNERPADAGNGTNST
jgi:hypothetical protein